MTGTDNARTQTPAYVNYAFSTNLDDGRKLVEASMVIEDTDMWIQSWFQGTVEPLQIVFDLPPNPTHKSTDYEGLSLSITLPPEAFRGSVTPSGYLEPQLSFITQPIKEIVPIFMCYPYCPGGGTPTFNDTFTDYTLTFSLLSTT